MFVNRGDDIFVIVNGACKAGDIAHIRERIGSRCEVITMPERALLALQGPKAVDALARLVPGVQQLVFMTGGRFDWNGGELFVTRSGYTGEDGFETLGARVAGRCAGARPAGAARGQAGRAGRAQFAAPGSGPVPLRHRTSTPRPRRSKPR